MFMRSISNTLNPFREYLLAILNALGLRCCIWQSLIFCFRQGLIFFSNWCGDSPSRADYTSFVTHIFDICVVVFVFFECPGDHLGGNLGIPASIWTPKGPNKADFGYFGPEIPSRLEALFWVNYS